MHNRIDRAHLHNQPLLIFGITHSSQKVLHETTTELSIVHGKFQSGRCQDLDSRLLSQRGLDESRTAWDWDGAENLANYLLLHLGLTVLFVPRHVAFAVKKMPEWWLFCKRKLFDEKRQKAIVTVPTKIKGIQGPPRYEWISLNHLVLFETGFRGQLTRGCNDPMT